MKEQVVVAYINEVLTVPEHLKSDVAEYRGYASERGECVSYPKHVDARMNQVFDSLVKRVTVSEIVEYVKTAEYQEMIES